MYLGEDSIYEFYLGDHQINEMYLGEDLVYSSGPFVGLKATPKLLNFNSGSLTKNLKIKSSEPWSLTTPAWITASVSTGDTGETIVSLTATTQTAETSGNIVIASQSFSATVSTNFTLVKYVHSSNMGDNTNYKLETGIIPDLTTYGIVKGKYVGYWTDSILVGYKTRDTNDWRLFKIFADSNKNTYMDVGSSRVTNVPIWTPVLNEDFDIEFGNLYIKNRLTETTVTGSPYTGSLTGESIKIELGVMWIESLQLYTQGSLVFDGKAATQNGQYGIYDSVSNTFLTSTSFTIVGES